MRLTEPYKLSEFQRRLLDVLEDKKEVTVEQLAELFDSTWEMQNVRMNMSNLRTKMRQLGDARTIIWDRDSKSYRLVSFIR